MFYPDNSACVSTSTGIIQKDCQHCFCRQDTAGSLHCCKCGYVLRPRIWITVPPSQVYTLATNPLGEAQDE